MQVDPIYISVDHNMTLTGMNIAGTYLNTATATYVLKDADGSTVSGGTGTLSYVSASNGNYLGVIESTVTALLTENARYWIEITFSQGSYQDFRRLPVRALYRTED